MRYADTPTLLYLNDQAKLLNLNQWVKAHFFDEVDPDGIHVLAYAFPHGLRPGSHERALKAPPHFRTAWYAQMRDGSDYLIQIDVTVEEYRTLPVLDGVPDELIGDQGDGTFVLPAIVTIGLTAIDGRYVLDVTQKRGAELGRGENPLLTVLKLEPLSPEQLAELRESVRPEDESAA